MLQRRGHPGHRLSRQRGGGDVIHLGQSHDGTRPAHHRAGKRGVMQASPDGNTSRGSRTPTLPPTLKPLRSASRRASGPGGGRASRTGQALSAAAPSGRMRPPGPRSSASPSLPTIRRPPCQPVMGPMLAKGPASRSRTRSKHFAGRMQSDPNRHASPPSKARKQAVKTRASDQRVTQIRVRHLRASLASSCVVNGAVRVVEASKVIHRRASARRWVSPR